MVQLVLRLPPRTALHRAFTHNSTISWQQRGNDSAYYINTGMMLLVKLLSREDILQTLQSLSHELAATSPRTELVLVGGAALVLLYGARPSTKDVDGLILAPTSIEPVRSAAKRVAASLGLPEDWLNDGAKGYVHGLALGDLVLDTPSLLVRTLAPQQLLAMKLSAWRDDIDIEDARLLLSKLAGSRDAVWKQIEPHLVPGRELKARYAFDDLWEARRGSA